MKKYVKSDKSMEIYEHFTEDMTDAILDTFNKYLNLKTSSVDVENRVYDEIDTTIQHLWSIYVLDSPMNNK